MDLFAYLDPGTGSVILQALLGGVAGLILSIKLFGKRFLSFLTPWRRKEKDTAPQATGEHEAV